MRDDAVGRSLDMLIENPQGIQKKFDRPSVGDELGVVTVLMFLLLALYATIWLGWPLHYVTSEWVEPLNEGKGGYNQASFNFAALAIDILLFYAVIRYAVLFARQGVRYLIERHHAQNFADRYVPSATYVVCIVICLLIAYHSIMFYISYAGQTPLQTGVPVEYSPVPAGGT